GYVNAPLDRGTSLKEKDTDKVKKRLRVINKKEDGLIQLKENFWNLYPDVMTESSNWLPKGILFDISNKRNNRKFAASIIKAIDRLKFKDFLIFNDQHMFLGFYQKELLNPKMYIYYMRDNLVKNPYWRKHGTRIEPLLIKKADVVTNNSLLYTEYGTKYNPHSYMVGQGCDVSLFNDENDRIALADDMKAIPRPVVGYVGYLTHRRLDIGLLEYLAVKKPDISFVYVGPEDDEFKASGLHDKSNVYFLGSRKPEELPSYVKGFDVAINPQIVNDATIGNYPRKIDEYLAMGKPTIGTWTKAMEYFKDDCYLANSHEDYEVLIEKALREDSPELREKRRRTGNSHSWENSVNEIYKAVETVAQKNNIKL
ncbi:MAG: glycosyltransferase family 1 protein, partial [Bacteroidetes bacterium]|nr:glycosyltransferase family 1 protein [Bacteroidota bacterium]